ncbi:MAG TPA: hypothetical protein PK293_06760 [Spirochaetota bacterium]|nr:hypothetical protein [Spirochaetota bacterium]
MSGAGGAIIIDDYSTLKIYDSVFIGNGASGTGGKGGAIYANNSVVTIIRTRFGDKDVPSSGNTSSEGGGAIYASGTSTVNILDNCEFYKNTTEGSGGAVYAISSTVLTVENSFFGSADENESGNKAINVTNGGGGAIYGNNQRCSFKNVKFINNKAARMGGAINFYLIDSDGTHNVIAEISGCTFDNNELQDSASRNGGAIYLNSPVNPEVILDNSIISNNSSINGGGLYFVKGNVSIANTLFSGNIATTSGGAMYFASTSADNYFVNLTFYNNVAVSGGAINFNPSSSVSINMYNSAFYGNTGGTSYNILKNANAVLSMNHSFYNGGISTSPNAEVECITANPDSPFISIDPASTSFLIPGTDLGDLGLFNKGLNTIPGFTIPSTDLGGNPRKVGTIDIGCYEKQ